MTTIYSTIDLPHGWHMMYQVKDAEEARKIAGDKVCYLLESRIIKSFYLFIPQVEK